MSAFKVNDDGSVDMADGKCHVSPNGTLSVSSDGFASHVTEISASGGITITNPGGMLEYNNGNFAVMDAAQDISVFAVTGDRRVGFFGAAPVNQPAFGEAIAGAAYTANEQTMLNKVYSALRALGLAS